MSDLAFAREVPALWVLCAKAAFDFMLELRLLDPVAARALLDDMRSVADKREDKDTPLWEQWAKAAFNVMIELQSHDPVAARALLDDMRSVADKRDDPRLREQWA